MSTKIYDGLRLVDPAPSLFDVVGTVAPAVKEQFKLDRRSIIVRSFAELVDRGPYGSDSDMVFLDAESQWMTMQNELGRHHVLNDPLRFSIVFGQAASGRTLALPYYSAASGYEEALMATGLFEEYAYQNSSDRPDSITAEDWETRRSDWDSVMNSEGTLNHLPMWQVTTLSETFSVGVLFEPKFDLDSLVTPRERLERALREALTNRRGTIEPSTVMSVIGADARTARAFVESLPDDSPHLPGPLPALRSTYSDLPGPLVIGDELIHLARQRD